MIYTEERCHECGRLYQAMSISSSMRCDQCRRDERNALPALTQNPKYLMMDVADRAYWNGVAFSDRIRYARRHQTEPKWYKPGEFFLKQLSEEEREVLRGLKSDDISNVRIDGRYVLSPYQFV